MTRLDYREEGFLQVSVRGIICEFSDMRSIIPREKYQYEVAGDDESGGDPVRAMSGVLVNFFGTLISDKDS